MDQSGTIPPRAQLLHAAAGAGSAATRHLHRLAASQDPLARQHGPRIGALCHHGCRRWGDPEPCRLVRGTRPSVASGNFGFLCDCGVCGNAGWNGEMEMGRHSGRDWQRSGRSALSVLCCRLVIQMCCFILWEGRTCPPR